MVHGGMTLIKYVLFLFNFIFWLSGIAIIVAGAVIQIKWTYYVNFLGDTFFSAPILLIIVGCIVALLGFFGCCGAIRENYCMTMTFAVLLGILFILELAAGIAGYVLRNELENVIKQQALDGLAHYNMTNSDLVTRAWDDLQHGQECCGIGNYSDWQNNTYFRDNNHVPQSCCKKPLCDVAVRNKTLKEAMEEIYTDACADRLHDQASAKIGVIGGILSGIALIQILGISFACCLSKSILKDYEDYYY